MYKNKKNGFTLVEVLIYTVLIGLIISAFITYNLMVLALHSKNAIMSGVINTSREISNYFSQEVKNANEIILPGLGATSSLLVVKTEDNKYATSSVIDGILTRQQDDEVLELNNQHSEVGDLLVQKLNSGDNKYAYTVSFTVGTTNNSYEFNHKKDIQLTITPY